MKYKLKFGKPVKSILQLQDAFFICISFIIVIILGCNVSFSQSVLKFNNELPKSTFELYECLLDSTVKKDTTHYNFKMTKSPTKALLYSAVLPGLGQFYNKSYWKIPVIWTVGGYFIYEIIKNNNSYLDYKSIYENSQTPANPGGDQRYRALREFYRDQRDQFYLYAGLVYLINLFDAYVDAHLFDFDVSDRIQVESFKSSRNIMKFKINL